MAVEFACAPITLFGNDVLSDMIPYIKRTGLSRALIVSDQGLLKAGLVEKLTGALEGAGINSSAYTDVEPNPTIQNVEEGCDRYRQDNCDFLISMGGGSPTDCAKAIRILVGNGGSLSDYKGGNKSRAKGPYYIAVNTTAGTASEISRAFLISDPDRQEKMIFKDDYAMPDMAVEDTALMMGLPPHITAQTGMDALTHAVEGFLSVRHSFMTDLTAEKSISMVSQFLPAAVIDPGNREAREGMIYAQYLAGMSFGNAGLGLVHAMAHPLGAVCHLPHGLCNAVLLPFVLDYYLMAGAERLEELGRVIEAGAQRNSAQPDGTAQAENGIAAIRELSGNVGTRVPLCSLGVREEELPLLADKALLDGCIITSPVLPDRDAVLDIYKRAWEGEGNDGTCR